jgi:hypothetical protein
MLHVHIKIMSKQPFALNHSQERLPSFLYVAVWETRERFFGCGLRMTERGRAEYNRERTHTQPLQRASSCERGHLFPGGVRAATTLGITTNVSQATAGRRQRSGLTLIPHPAIANHGIP